VGQLDAGEATARQAIVHTRSLGFSWSERRLTLLIGVAQVLRGREKDGIETLKPLFEGADSRNTLVAEVVLALAHFRCGELDEAERHARRVLQQGSLYPNVEIQANAVLARVLLGQGRFLDAVAHARRGLEIRERGSMDCIFEPMLRLALAESLEAAGETSASADALRAARDYVLRQAEALSCEGLRESYLRNALEGDRIVKLAQERLV
jgi:Flp pilus assembly protein TadD